MKVLIIGANGYLGARLFEDLSQQFDVIGTYHQQQFRKELLALDVTNAEQVLSLCQQVQPDIIIQTANHSSPRPAEHDKTGYVHTNYTSTQNIVEAANLVGAKVIFISSFAAIEPDNIYGELKAKSEDKVEETQAGYLILRPSLILGKSPNTENDRPFNRILKLIGTDSVGEFDTSWKFQPTYIGHISQVIIAAIKQQVWNKTVHVFCPTLTTRFEVARDILQPFEVQVRPIDKMENMKTQEKDERELVVLGLPTCSYQQMLGRIHQEIQ